MDRLFNRYVDAFLRQDPAAVVEFYAYPVTVYKEDGVAVVLDEQAFTDNLLNLFEVYLKLGVAGIEFEIDAVDRLNTGLQLYSVKWVFLKENRTEIYSATVRYLVRNADTKIVGLIGVDEMAKVQALQ